MYLKAFFMLQCVVVLAIVYMIYAVVYRLYFHPLARFPGPKLASITYWYEFYYDIIRRGQYTFKLRELHEKYGQFSLSLSLGSSRLVQFVGGLGLNRHGVGLG